MSYSRPGLWPGISGLWIPDHRRPVQTMCSWQQAWIIGNELRWKLLCQSE